MPLKAQASAAMPAPRDRALSPIVTTKALLAINRHPSEADAREALRYNLCRCGAHVEIMRAVMRAAGQTAEVDG